MAKRKTRRAKSAPPAPIGRPTIISAPDPKIFVSGPKLRAMFGISPVTLWRWRHDEQLGFPPAREINGRLFFRLSAVLAWFQRQRDAKPIAA